MDTPRTKLAQLNKDLHRQAMTVNRIAATTSSLHAPTHRWPENTPAVRGAAVRAPNPSRQNKLTRLGGTSLSFERRA